MHWIAVPAGILLGFVGSVPPTGPITVLVLERGISGRFREGFGVALGAAVAESLYCGLALFGLSALFERYPALEVYALRLALLMLVGVGLTFMAFKTKIVPQADRGNIPVTAWLKQAALGFTLVITNPVILLTWSGAVAALYALAGLRFDLVDKFGFAAGVGLGVTAWFYVMLKLLERFEGRLTVTAAQWLVRAMGALLVAIAAGSAPRALR